MNKLTPFSATVILLILTIFISAIVGQTDSDIVAKANTLVMDLFIVQIVVFILARYIVKNKDELVYRGFPFHPIWVKLEFASRSFPYYIDLITGREKLL